MSKTKISLAEYPFSSLNISETFEITVLPSGVFSAETITSIAEKDIKSAFSSNKFGLSIKIMFLTDARMSEFSFNESDTTKPLYPPKISLKIFISSFVSALFIKILSNGIFPIFS